MRRGRTTVEFRDKRLAHGRNEDYAQDRPRKVKSRGKGKDTGAIDPHAIRTLGYTIKTPREMTSGNSGSKRSKESWMGKSIAN